MADPEKWQDYYKILDRQDKDTRTSIQVKMYQDYLGVDPLLDRFCEEQMGRLRSNKNAFYGMETAEDFGDYLLRTKQISKQDYEAKQAQAIELLKGGGK